MCTPGLAGHFDSIGVYVILPLTFSGSRFFSKSRCQLFADSWLFPSPESASFMNEYSIISCPCAYAIEYLLISQLLAFVRPWEGCSWLRSSSQYSWSFPAMAPVRPYFSIKPLFKLILNFNFCTSSPQDHPCPTTSAIGRFRRRWWGSLPRTSGQ